MKPFKATYAQGGRVREVMVVGIVPGKVSPEAAFVDDDGTLKTDFIGSQWRNCQVEGFEATRKYEEPKQVIINAGFVPIWLIFPLAWVYPIGILARGCLICILLNLWTSWASIWASSLCSSEYFSLGFLIPRLYSPKCYAEEHSRRLRPSCATS